MPSSLVHDDARREMCTSIDFVWLGLVWYILPHYLTARHWDKSFFTRETMLGALSRYRSAQLEEKRKNIDGMKRFLEFEIAGIFFISGCRMLI